MDYAVKTPSKKDIDRLKKEVSTERELFGYELECFKQVQNIGFWLLREFTTSFSVTNNPNNMKLCQKIMPIVTNISDGIKNAGAILEYKKRSKAQNTIEGKIKLLKKELAKIFTGEQHAQLAQKIQQLQTDFLLWLKTDKLLIA